MGMRDGFRAICAGVAGEEEERVQARVPMVNALLAAAGGALAAASRRRSSAAGALAPAAPGASCAHRAAGGEAQGSKSPDALDSANAAAGVALQTMARDSCGAGARGRARETGACSTPAEVRAVGPLPLALLPLALPAASQGLASRGAPVSTARGGPAGVSWACAQPWGREVQAWV